MRKICFLTFVSILCLTSCKNDTDSKVLVTFKNYDETILYSVLINKGDNAVYEGKIPEKPISSDNRKAFSFCGWGNTSLNNVTKDTTFYAQYNEINRYKATFLNYDLEKVLFTTFANEGTLPEYNGITPRKPSTEDFSYKFIGWDHEIKASYKDETYVAQFQEIPFVNSIYIKNADKAEIHTLSSIPLNYLETEDNPFTENNEIAEYLYSNKSKNSCDVLDFTISWEAEGKINKPYNLFVSTDVYFEKNVFSYKNIYNEYYSLTNLVPDTYYYQIIDSSNEPVKSVIQSFKIVDRIRTMDGAGELQNLRDLGGYITNDNRSIKYNLIYRSANFAQLTSNGEQFIKNTLNLKTEIDLRFNKDGKTYDKSEYPIDGVKFLQCGLTDAYPLMVSDSNTKKDIKILMETVSNVDNLPLDFHCTNGADRTGYLGLLLEGALGIKDEDIYRDYELTTFYRYYQPRCDIEYDDINYKFNEDGYRSDTWGNGSFESVILTLREMYNMPTNTISEVVTKFLTEGCGVSENTINLLKTNLLND